jgi:hypothetical protein
MIQVQQTVSAAASSTVPLLLTEGDVQRMAESPEQVMEEIWVRATQVSSTLESIFHEPHREPQWDLDG